MILMIKRGDKKYLSGVLAQEFKVGDKVRLRTPDEIDEIDDISNEVVKGCTLFSSYKEWLEKGVRARNQAIRPDETKTIVHLRKLMDGHYCVSFEPNGLDVVSWALILADEKVEESKKYRTTEDGFLTCDDNWKPENRWF